jgi:hypothetical protein
MQHNESEIRGPGKGCVGHLGMVRNKKEMRCVMSNHMIKVKEKGDSKEKDRGHVMVTKPELNINKHQATLSLFYTSRAV